MKGRESNFELLRIISMLMIIIGHIIMFHPSTLKPNSGVDFYIGNFTRSFVMVAVNCFILISGYYGIKFKIGKLFRLGSLTWSWSVILCFGAIFAGIQSFDVQQCIKLLFPIVSKQWWFITVYIALFILSPWLNQFVQKVSRDSYKKLLCVLFACFCIWPSFCYIINAQSITNDAGYGIVNFIFLYLVGRYIQLYFTDKYSSLIYGCAYVICSLGIFGANMFFTKVLGFYFNSFFSYDTIFCFMGSIMLFMCFKNMKFFSTKINALSKETLAVYIIHMHPSIAKYLFEDLLRVPTFSYLGYGIILCIYPLLIYLIGIMFEEIRKRTLGRVMEKINFKVEIIIMNYIRKLKHTVN